MLYSCHYPDAFSALSILPSNLLDSIRHIDLITSQIVTTINHFI